MRIIAFLFFFTSSLFASVCAQDVEINGFATLAKDSKVYAFEVSDGITNQLSLVAQTIGDEDGNFSLEIPIKQTKPLVICVGNAKTRIWVDPKQKYKLTFLQPDTTLTQNNFVQFWESRIECESNVATNALIGLINTQIAEFISNNAYEYLLLKSNSSKASVQRMRNKNPESDLVKFSDVPDSTAKAQSKFYESLILFESEITSDLKTVLEKNSFLENYLFCKLSQLKLLTLVSDSYKEMSNRIDLSNPAFCDWMNIFASNYFNPNLNVEEKQTFDSLVLESSKPEELIKFLNRENNFNMELEELIFVTALRNKYYSNEWSASFATRLNNLVRTHSKFENSKALSTHFDKELSKQIQTELNDFTLIDDHGDKWIFSEQCDRNMYLYFFNSNKSSQRDLALLNQLANKYKNDFRIVAIGMQRSYEDYLKAVQPMKLTNLTALYGGNDFQIIDNLHVQSVPFAIETNSKKKIAFKYTPLPSEGIQLKWEEILRKNKK
jgi:hypothetical protein